MVVLQSFSPPSDGIILEQPSTKLFISEREIGCGTLYITESKLSWRNNVSGEGLSLFYPDIAVHAVSRDLERFGSECMILMVEAWSENMENGEEADSEDESGNVTEMRFVPDDKSRLDAMYQAMTHCQSQHPDPNDSFSEDGEFVDADEDGDDSWAGGDAGNTAEATGRTNDIRALNGLRNNQQGDEEMETDGQFEDAEDD